MKINTKIDQSSFRFFGSFGTRDGHQTLSFEKDGETCDAIHFPSDDGKWELRVAYLPSYWEEEA